MNKENTKLLKQNNQMLKALLKTHNLKICERCDGLGEVEDKHFGGPEICLRCEGSGIQNI